MRTSFLTIIAGLLLIAPTQAVEKVVFTSNRTGNADIFVMAPDGTGQTNITNSGDTEEFPTWNPDGTKIIYTRAPAEYDPTIRDNIYTINPDGTGIATIVIGGEPLMPSFQTNSNRISFSRSSGNDFDVYTSNQDGSAQTSITSDFYGDYYARWSPNGTKFTYYTFSDLLGGGTTPDLYFANPDGSGKVRITDSGQNQYATWSPDGGSIVFQSGRDGSNQIYTMSPYGTTQTRLTNNNYSDTAPVFSPDGRKIMFVSNRDGNNEIYVMNADGSNQTRITNNTYEDNFPTWTQVLDANAPTVRVGDTGVLEGSSGKKFVTLNLTLSAPSTTPVNVIYRTFDISASAGSDYVAIPLTTVTFTPGQISKTITLQVIGDTIDEPEESFCVRISAVGAKVGKQLGGVNIMDDDATPTLKVSNLSRAEGNTNSTANVTVALSAASGQTVKVNYETSNGTALAGSDYLPQSGTLTFTPGQKTATIPVTIIGDNVREPNEAFYIDLSEAENATIATSRGNITLTNDDTLPGLSINDVSVVEGVGAQFTVSLSGATTTPVQVKYKTVDATATAGSDYAAINGTLIIPAGKTSATITVPTRTDSVVEASETFNLVLSDAVKATLTKSTGVGTITNDTPVKLLVSDISIKEGNSGTRFIYFTVSLSEPVPVTVNMEYGTADGTATKFSDYTPTSGPIIFGPNELSRIVAVPVLPDTVIESNETFLLNVFANVNGATTTATGMATLINDDGATSTTPTSKTVSGKTY